LELIAFRHGRHVCRRDIKRRGRLFAFLSATARLMQVGTSTALKSTWARFCKRGEEVVSQSCQWRRACGYWSFALSGSVDATGWTMHRGQG
jgi:hypothetical protein